MARIFRKIRMENLFSNTFKRYFLYAFGEIVLIVIYIKEDGNNLSIEEFKEIKNQIENRLIADFPSLAVEISLKD